MPSRQYSKYHKILLYSTQSTLQLASNDYTNVFYGLQGWGLGGTIKSGRMYVNSLVSTLSNTNAYQVGDDAYYIQVRISNLPFSTASLETSSNSLVDKVSDIVQVCGNNVGNDNFFGYVSDSTTDFAQGRQFQNFQPANGLNIQLLNIMGETTGLGTVFADGTDPYVLELVIEEFGEPVGQPLNITQTTAQ